MRDKNPVICFFGYICNNESNHRVLSWFETQCSFLQTDEIQKYELKILNKHIKDKIHNLEVHSIRLRDYLQKGKINTGTELIAKLSDLCEEELIYSRQVNLIHDNKLLWKNIRKSYKSLINWGEKNLEINLYDWENIDKNIIDEFRRLHIREAGRETRSELSWHRQYEAIKNKEAFCLTGSLEGVIVTAGYFLTGNNHCYYGSSASRRDLFEKPLFHSIMWKAIQQAKLLDLRVFDTGLQYPYQTLKSKSLSKKEIQISDFKSGFGGENKLAIDFDMVISQSE